MKYLGVVFLEFILPLFSLLESVNLHCEEVVFSYYFFKFFFLCQSFPVFFCVTLRFLYTSLVLCSHHIFFLSFFFLIFFLSIVLDWISINLFSSPFTLYFLIFILLLSWSGEFLFRILHFCLLKFLLGYFYISFLCWTLFFPLDFVFFHLIEHGSSSYFMSLIISTSELPGGWPLSTVFSLELFILSWLYSRVLQMRNVYSLDSLVAGSS